MKKSWVVFLLACLLLVMVPFSASAADTKRTIDASGVTASADDGNVAANTVDGNLSTRWSASGDGQWIQFNLGADHEPSNLRLS